MNNLFPVFMKLEGKKCLVVGGGVVALRKVEKLRQSYAAITVVAPEVCQELSDLTPEGAQFAVHRERYNASYLDGIVLVFACTSDQAVNMQVYEDCMLRSIPVNVVDVPDLCSFFVPSVVTQGDIKIAVSTNGRCSAFAKRIRTELETQFDERYALAISYIGMLRDYLKTHEPDIDERGRILNAVSFSPDFFKRIESLSIETVGGLNAAEELKRWC